MICIGLACLAISRGVSSIEPVNRVIVPTLLLIVVFTFYWALFMPYGGMGIIHMFSPSWSKSIIYILYYCFFFPIESFGNADLWRDALTQNAWDTGTRASNMAYSYILLLYRCWWCTVSHVCYIHEEGARSRQTRLNHTST